jgi:thioesterase domain-containing protein/acyl carrier protein
MMDRDFTSVEALVAELASLDVKLSVDEGDLRCSAPTGVLTEALRSKLAGRKRELLEFLQAAGRPASSGEPPLESGSRDEPIPLSPGQERIFSLAKLRPESCVYNTSTVYRLSGSLDVPALEQSLNELLRRHEILRTTFRADQGEPRQHISAPHALVLPIVNIASDLKLLPKEQREQEVLRLLQAELHVPIDLERGPLWRPLLLRLGENEHVLSLTLHHAIFDGGSDSILLSELSSFYKAISVGEVIEVADLPVQYADFACWEHRRLRGEVGARQLSYWKQQLDGAITELRLPRDGHRSAGATFRGSSTSFELPAALTSSLAALSRRERAGLFATLLAAYCALLNRYTGQEDLVVCSPFASRDRAELEAMIGYFNNIVVMRADLSADPSFRELMMRVRALGIEAADNQNLPLQRLAELPNLVRVPLTRGMFCYQDLSNRVLDLPGITASPIDLRKETADFDLAMYMQSTAEGRLTGVLEYDAELFDPETIRQFTRDFQTVLRGVSAHPDQRLSQLPRFGPQPAEVESHLRRHPQIEQAVVLDLPDRSGSVAYLVLDEYHAPSLNDVRQIVRSEFPEYLVPRSFVPVDQMPLTADGTIDRSALPLRVIEGGRADTGYLAPRTDLERTLASIWRRVLWLDQDVGIRDRFADLGGHSLLSVRLVLEVEKELRRGVPVRALARLSTIEEMAELLERQDGDEEGPSSTPLEIPRQTYHALLTYTASWVGERVTPESLVVGLNTEGMQEPLFWCLQRYSELTQLAKYLGSDQPVYGMRSGNRVMLRTQRNIDALAAYYVGEILATKPEGPFFLGGNCQAGEIAFQIAKGLEQRGHEVPLLVLLEKFVPQHYSGRVAMLFGAESNRNPYLRYREPEIGWKKFYTGEHSADLVSGKHARFFREPNVQVLAATVKQKLKEAQRVPARPTEARSGPRLQRLTRAAYRAKLTARPSWIAAPGEEIRIRVGVENVSPETWRSGELSGIALANRWLNAKEEVVEALDGRARLVGDLPPGSRVELELSVRAPRKTGRWLLELDLIDEGITSFGDQGSEPSRVEVRVQRGKRLHSALRTLFPNLRGRG